MFYILAHKIHFFLLFCACLKNKEADALSMFSSDIYNLGKTASFKVAATESKLDRKFHVRPFCKASKSSSKGEQSYQSTSRNTMLMTTDYHKLKLKP